MKSSKAKKILENIFDISKPIPFDDSFIDDFYEIEEQLIAISRGWAD